MTFNADSPIADLDPDQHYYNFSFYEQQDISKYYSIDEYNAKFTCDSKLSLLNCNIRSFFANIDAMLNYIVSLKVRPQIIVCTENWLDPLNVDMAKIDGYESYHTLRNGGRGGGVSVFCQNNIKSSIVDISLSNENIESCCVYMQVGGEGLYVLAVYRPHSGTIAEFGTAIQSLLNCTRLMGKRVVVVGDFNLNLLNTENASINQFIYDMHSLHFVPVILKPTRFPSSDNFNPTLLDQIWVNFPNKLDSGIFWADVTDHCPCFVSLDMPRVSTESSKHEITFRNHSPANVDKFLACLTSVNWEESLRGSVNAKCLRFIELVNEQYCKNFPLQTKTISSKRLSKPWLTSGIIRSIKTKSVYFKMYKRGLISETTNNTYKNLLNKTIRKAKQNYFRNLFSQTSGNIKKTWENIKKVTSVGKKTKKNIDYLVVNDQHVSNPSEIAESLNYFFSSNSSTLASQIPASSFSPLFLLNLN